MNTLILLAGLYVMISCSRPSEMQPAPSSDCIAKADAEKILGQPATITESKSGVSQGVIEYACTYTASAQDSDGRLGNLYYISEVYPSADLAHEKLAFFSEQNKNSPGWKSLAGVGDEAITHTDQTNFQLVITRKSNKMIRFKVNKLTASTAPIDTLHAIAKRVIEGL